jgi:DNA-binding HxlR family transcriptional regulator
MAETWEAIRYLSNHEAAMFIFWMLENKRGWVPFYDLQKSTNVPIENILRDMMALTLVARQSGGGRDKYSLTNYGDALSSIFREMEIQIVKMMKEGVSSKDMAQMAQEGELHRLLLQRSLKEKKQDNDED